MDTILYFYRKRDIQKPEIEPVGLKTYLLIRIGLDVERDRWFTKKLEETGRGEDSGKTADTQEAGDRSAGFREGSLRGKRQEKMQGNEEEIQRCQGKIRKCLEKMCKRQEKRHRRAREREEARRMAARGQMICEVKTELEELAGKIAELTGDMEECQCVYEDSLRRALVGERGRGEEDWFRRAFAQESLVRESEMTLPILWEKYIPMEEFHGYAERFWVEQLFSMAASPHLVILGTAPCVPKLIEAHARGMKSLRWILAEAEWNEDLSAFAEEFYTEYGLAIELQLVEDIGILRRPRFFWKEPVAVVDFTGEISVPVSSAVGGSVWLDVFPTEEKKRRILAKGEKITYFSMKELWKVAQKRCNCPVLP